MFVALRCSEVLLCTVLVYVSTASCQLKVSSFIGDDVLLPCVYAENEPLPEKVSVFWRDKDDNIVLDIRNNAPDTSSNQMFRGRVVSFPELYRAGNFSIMMTDVRQSDSSQYDCHIPAVDFQQRIVLIVSGPEQVT
ncbi:hypothetical protein GBF38_008645 [Nibea albiflora]|uniref:Uncharacterized protein n=1 Tax=Nibea albiflora TaxID=240163 RepID=A0ACB7EQE8_NIBAL|nr:hypothetical protein GBF38_008645 [Nibea albiflora]